MTKTESEPRLAPVTGPRIPVGLVQDKYHQLSIEQAAFDMGGTVEACCRSDSDSQEWTVSVHADGQRFDSKAAHLDAAFNAAYCDFQLRKGFVWGVYVEPVTGFVRCHFRRASLTEPVVYVGPEEARIRMVSVWQLGWW